MHIPILVYHNIASVPRELQRQRSLYVPPRLFARQMWLLQKLGYRGLSMAAATPYLSGERKGRVVAITLDDGYVDNLSNALPILKRYNFSATCYVVSSALGLYNKWDADKLGIRKPTMNAAQLRTWSDAGMEVGAHTCTHPYLTQCDDTQLVHEIAGSKASLEQVIDKPISQFCYPYGDVNTRVANATRQAGFTAATTTQRGRANKDNDPMLLPRIKITRSQILPSFAQRVFTAYEDRRG